ncbi:hypothetical protein [Echinicola strongylocentroti]|uniref:hypothetical protein n=1 Tax=Echinicola strongylocentroti TaxID=1795355 RepID=UPI0013A6FC99|nr:hypothetical protein [Echinicola strongylocentroti]
MKVKLLTDIKSKSLKRVILKGEEVTAEDLVAKVWIKKGYATEVQPTKDKKS